MIICADDYGLSNAVDDAVIELIQKDRITATSCIVSNYNAKYSTLKLQKYMEKIDIGMHLLLTDGKPLSHQKSDGGLVDHHGNLNNFWKLTAKTYSHRIQFESVYKEIRAQVEYFNDLFGRMPYFIDGHKHVQQLPVIRNALMKLIKDINFSPYLRIAALPKKLKMDIHFSKTLTFYNMIINYPGAEARKLFSGNGFRCNRYLLGYYNNNSKMTFSEIFKRYTEITPTDRDIFFCHPGHEEPHRVDCLRFLLSDKFKEICSERGIIINRF